MSTADIKAIATQIMRDIGAGYSEDNYQQAHFNKLVKIDPAAVKERTIPIIYDGESIGTCRADIVTTHHVIEIKAMRKMQSGVRNQIRKYLVRLMHMDGISRTGLVINFNQDTEEAEFIEYNVNAEEHMSTSIATVYTRRKHTPLQE